MVWAKVADLVSKAWRDLKGEQNQELSEVNLTSVNAACDSLIDLFLQNLEGEESAIHLRREATIFKKRVLLECVDRLRSTNRTSLDQFLAELQKLKLVVLRGVFDQEMMVECIDIIIERLRSSRATISDNQKTLEVTELRKENALLKQTTHFQREEIDFLKNRNSFEERRASFERIATNQLAKLSDSKGMSFEAKGISVDTISKAPTPTRQNQRRCDISRLPKPTTSSKPVIGKLVKDSRKNSLSTIKNDGLSDKLLPQLGDDLIGLLAENRDLKNKIEKMSSDLKFADSKLQDFVAERHHTVSIMNTDNNSVVETLKQQLQDIKDSHRREKSLLAKRMEEETERAKKRIQEMESNFAQKAVLLSQETENRYTEMTVTLKGALETASYELKETQNKLKDFHDQKRLESVRYESRIQDLKNELRKAETKYETLKRKIKEGQTFDVELNTQKFNKSEQNKRISNLLCTVKSESNFDKDFLKTEFLQSTDGPDISDLTSAKRLNFAEELKHSSPKIIHETDDFRTRIMKKPKEWEHEESLDFINSSPNLKGTPSSHGTSKVFEHRISSKRFPLNIKVSDEELLTKSSKFDKFRPTQNSKEDLLHSDIIKYFNNSNKGVKSSKKQAQFDITASAMSLKHADSSSQNLHSSYTSKKYDMSPSSVSKPLDYFIKKKQSLQSPLN